MTKPNAAAQVPQAIDSHKIPVTFFDDYRALTRVQEDVTLPELADDILHMTDNSKEQLPWLKMATFGDVRSKKGSYRTNANLQSISGVEVDYDGGGITFDLAVLRLAQAGLRGLVYTSASYRKGDREKWRVLCPTSGSMLPEQRAPLVAVLNGALGGGIDPASFVLSQAYYYGSVNDNPEHRVELLDGDFIDRRPDLWEGRIEKPRMEKTLPETGVVSSMNESPGYSEAEIDQLLERSQYRNSDGSGNWHPNMLAVTASLVSRGLGNDAIADRCAIACEGGRDDGEMLALVEQARSKWGISDPDIPAGAKLGPDVLAAIAADAPRPIAPNWRERYVETGYPKASLHNARAAIEALGARCSIDTFHNKLYLGRSSAAAPSEPNLPFCGLVTDAAIGGLRMCLSDTFGLDFTEKHVRDAVNIMCNENAFNPVVEMLAEAQASWDGVERLDRMAVDHFNAADTELNRACVRKVMIAAVARARRPGCKFDTILVMESPEGWNKSSAWALLAGEDNFSDQSILGQAGREVQEQLAGVWIHENAELAGMRKAEVEVVKAFASRQVDRARPAFGHFLVEQPRHSIEVATTNDREYLLSLSGNRRFWPIEVGASIDLGKLRAARLQLWGEAAHYQSQGEALTLPEALWAAARAVQETRRVEHPWEAKLAAMSIAPEVDVTGGWGHRGGDVIQMVGTEQRVATVDIFDKVLGVPAGQQNNGHAKTVASLMRQLGWEHCVFNRDGKAIRGYRRT